MAALIRYESALILLFLEFFFKTALTIPLIRDKNGLCSKAFSSIVTMTLMRYENGLIRVAKWHQCVIILTD